MPLLSSISHQICKSSSAFPLLLLDLRYPPGKKGLSPAKIAALVAGTLLSAAAVWLAIPFLFGFLSSVLRSSAAPRYLFLAVNFIIFAVWKLSENRAIHAEEEKNSDHEAIPLRRQDLGSYRTVHLLEKSSVEDCNEIPSIHGETATSEYYIEPASELSCGTTELEKKEKHSDHEAIPLRRQDLGSSHTVHLLEKSSVEDRNEIPSIHGETAPLEHYIEEKNSDHGAIPLRRQDLGSSHTVHLLQKASVENRNEIPSIHGETDILEFYAEPDSELSCVTTEREEKIPIAAAPSSSSLSSALMLNNPEMEETTVNDLDEEDSLDATWNSIMRKSGRPETTNTAGRVSASKPRGGNASSEGVDDINQRFDEFIKKNYDQIRLRKQGEAIHQPRRIR